MAECAYPLCPEPAARSLGRAGQPEPAVPALCEPHAALLERDDGGADPVFWHWAQAMMR